MNESTKEEMAKEMAHQPQLHSQPKLFLVYVSGFEEEQKEEKRKK